MKMDEMKCDKCGGEMKKVHQHTMKCDKCGSTITVDDTKEGMEDGKHHENHEGHHDKK